MVGNLVRGAEIGSNFGPCQHFRSYARRKTAYSCTMPKEDSGTAGDIIDKAYIYLTDGSYPADATSNDKRAIRRKASKFVLYKKSSCIRSLRGAWMARW